MKSKKSKRGGKRPGSGRKKGDGPKRVSMSLYVREDTRDTLLGMVQPGESLGQAVDRVVGGM